MIRSTPRRDGFTLIEVLIAALVLGVILALLGGIFSTSRKALVTTEEATDRQQEAETAAQLLQYEIGLAGYRSTGAGYTANDFGGASTLEIVPGAPSDTIRVRYYEDRLFDGTTNTQLQTVQFDVRAGATGPALFRKEGAGAAQSAVAGVRAIKVVNLVYREALSPSFPYTAATTILPDELAGISVRLTFDDGREGTILIGLENAQIAPQFVAP